MRTLKIAAVAAASLLSVAVVAPAAQAQIPRGLPPGFTPPSGGGGFTPPSGGGGFTPPSGGGGFTP
ncbi:MAG: hypothetical protein ACKOFP_10800, partial [Actinomycetota bacterium]